jgi:biopolymer transport protein ExbD
MKKKKRSHSEVELNLAAMLDMAFQLLTFFILTFKPAPVEGEIALRMPPPMPITQTSGKKAGADPNDKNPLKGLNSLIISVLPNKSGGLGTMQVGEGAVGSLARLDERLRSVLSDASSPFDQVIIQVGSGLRYDALMSVVDICTRQTIGNGQKLSKLSFVELPDGSG